MKLYCSFVKLVLRLNFECCNLFQWKNRFNLTYSQIWSFLKIGQEVKWFKSYFHGEWNNGDWCVERISTMPIYTAITHSKKTFILTSVCTKCKRDIYVIASLTLWQNPSPYIYMHYTLRLYHRIKMGLLITDM